MTELTIRPEEIRAAIESNVASYSPETTREEVGRVIETGDGIARVEGLHSAMTNELLEFEGGLLGLALNLDVREIGVVLLGDGSKIEEGQSVKRTGEILSVPVGDGYLGRVVDPLGNPIDGQGPIADEGRRPLELQAPTVVQRQPVKEPMQTGIKAIDAMTAIGRGQRQLIIGDRQTGKTAVALDTIINQRENWATGDPKQQVKCIYVAIGQKGSTIAAVRGALEEYGALEYTTIVAAPASDPAGFKYLAPYTGSAIGQHWMYKGQNVLIVFDDLSKQAEAYRAVSLLLRRPPGREAYPGDVFYLHSRLLERCAKLSDDLGAGSMTGLPIIETKANDVSAYIPTNVISITDGQCFLESDLFNSGVRPAINVGISVSRVGGSAQVKAMKKVAGRLRLDLAQFRELGAFAAFGSDLDSASKAQLERGARLVELLKQPQYTPFSVEREVVSVWSGTTGKLDDVPVEDIRRFEAEFLDYVARDHKGILDTIKNTKGLSDDTVTLLDSAIAEFKKGFTTSAGHLLVNDEPVAAMEEEHIDVTQIKVARSELLMGAQLRVFRRRIKSVGATKRITKAMELIASSRIVKAQQRVDAALPYTTELVRALSAAAAHSNSGHLFVGANPTSTRAAMCLITADRGLAGAYSSAAIKEGEALTNLLHERGLEVRPYLVGRKAVGFYKFRERDIAGQWTGFTDQPTYDDAKAIADALLEAFRTPIDGGGCDEIHIVYTHFENMAVQQVRTRRLLPVEIVEEAVAPESGNPYPLYNFEPSPQGVLDALLPKYITNLVYTALLLSAASEHAARRRAMKSATDNADELMKSLTRQANQARQAEITQEISEIVGGADALVSASAGS